MVLGAGGRTHLVVIVMPSRLVRELYRLPLDRKISGADHTVRALYDLLGRE